MTRAMKDSGVAWIGEIPEHWTTCRIKDRCRLIGGSTPSAQEIGDEYDINWATPTDFEDITRNFSCTSRKISAVGHQQIGNTLVKVGAVLVSSRAPAGKVAYVTYPLSFNQGCKGLIPRKDMNGVFAFYVMVSMRSAIECEARGTTFQEISGVNLGRIHITIPPLSEQLSIADYLDQQTTLIDQRLITLAEKKAVLAELRKATIHEAVTKGLNKALPMRDSGVAWIGAIPQGWKLVRVKDVSPVNRGSSPRPIDDPIYFDDEGEYAWVRIADVSASLDGFLETTTQRLSKLGQEKSVKRKPGDLFLSIAGTVGKACITKIKACIHDGFVYFPRMNDEATKRFFFYLFNSGLAYDGLGKFGTQLNLNTETVGNILVPLPPLSEQLALADHLDQQTQQFDAQMATLDAQAQVLKELRKAIIHEAVTGKIDLSSYAPPQPQQAQAA